MQHRLGGQGSSLALVPAACVFIWGHMQIRYSSAAITPYTVSICPWAAHNTSGSAGSA